MGTAHRGPGSPKRPLNPLDPRNYSRNGQASWRLLIESEHSRNVRAMTRSHSESTVHPLRAEYPCTSHEAREHLA